MPRLSVVLLLVGAAAGWWLSWEYWEGRVTALEAGIARATAEAERRTAEIDAQTTREADRLRQRERELEQAWQAFTERVNQQEIEGCEVPAALIEQLNALR